MLALVLVFAFLVQMLVPALANAGAAASGQITICTTMGLQTVDTDGDEPPKDAHDCQHCVCPAPVATAETLLTSIALTYTVEPARVAETPRGLRPQARAPPRPPGQGPPHSNV
jgi:hypothetical protein